MYTTKTRVNRVQPHPVNGPSHSPGHSDLLSGETVSADELVALELIKKKDSLKWATTYCSIVTHTYHHA